MILIDADMLLFAATSSSQVEVDINDEQQTRWVDLPEARDKMTTQLLDIYAFCGEHHAPVLCFSSGQSWRRSIYPRYKESRRTRSKPIGYTKLMGEYMEINGERIHGLEADDLIGILSSRHNEEHWIVSGDKDLDQIEGKHYWPTEDGGDFWVVEPEAARRKFWTQTLIGDSTDDIPGCPTIGAKRGPAILSGCVTDMDYWEAIVSTYEKQLKDREAAEKEAILTANLVRIMRDKDYDRETGTVIEWKPPTWTPTAG